MPPSPGRDGGGGCRSGHGDGWASATRSVGASAASRRVLVSDDAAVVQEERQPLVLELAEPVTDALDLLAEQVDGPGSGVSDPVAGGGCEHIGL